MTKAKFNLNFAVYFTAKGKTRSDAGVPRDFTSSKHLIITMSVVIIVGPKCTLAASHAVPY